MGVYLTGVCFMGVHFINGHLTGIHLTGVHLISVHASLIAEVVNSRSCLWAQSACRSCLPRSIPLGDATFLFPISTTRTSHTTARGPSLLALGTLFVFLDTNMATAAPFQRHAEIVV
jgi:hypothetical protein